MVVAVLLLGAGACGTDDAPLSDCEIVEVQLLECFGEAPADLDERCEANADLFAAIRGADCETLEHAEHKQESSASVRLAGEPCVVNFECEGDLVCRFAADGGEPRCSVPGVHQDEHAADRTCDPVTDADCVEGDRCLGIGGRHGTCEPAMLGAPCDCPYGDESCAGQAAGCGPDLGCVQGVCRRGCTSAVPGTCPSLYDVCAQIDHSRGYSLGSWCHAR